MGKSPDAFRTITEVSDWLETPTHVLRFWETKFPALKPVKRAGGRRYYRPGDMALLAGIKALLHEQGMSIKGVQKLLRERGPRHVAGQSPLPWDAETMDAVAWEPPEAPPGGPPAAGPAAELRDGMAAPAEGLAEGLGEGLGEATPGAEDFALPPPPVDPEGEEALTFLDAVLAGTARRMREGAPMAQGEDEGGAPEVVAFPDGARPREEAPAGHAPMGHAPAGHDPVAHAPIAHVPVPAGDAHAGTRPCERLLLLLGRADRSLLRARADRIAPLVARLGAARNLGGGAGAGRPPGPLRARGDSL